ncbi:MAG: hypothetical protein NPIRA03_40170 [Nitrospirales bacterium]|nr:MAG: hypothetical protein NPIRA03_40170 [Nitrospirales bacterium]
MRLYKKKNQEAKNLKDGISAVGLITMKEIGEAFFLVAFRYNNNKGLSRAFYVSIMFPIFHARVNGEVYFPFP